MWPAMALPPIPQRTMLWIPPGREMFRPSWLAFWASSEVKGRGLTSSAPQDVESIAFVSLRLSGAVEPEQLGLGLGTRGSHSSAEVAAEVDIEKGGSVCPDVAREV